MAKKPAAAAKKVANVVAGLVRQLEDLTSEERKRAVDAALTVFGDVYQGSSSRAKTTTTQGQGTGAEEPLKGISVVGSAWMKKNGISQEQIDEAFDFENGKVTLILDAIGKSAREKTVNTYLLTGVAAMLESGWGSFSDETARTNCESLGCYDKNNHAKYMKKDFGNKITGSKKAGWKLTAPGLTAAAAALKPVEREKK
jgi:hypothetical protein